MLDQDRVEKVRDWRLSRVWRIDNGRENVSVYQLGPDVSEATMPEIVANLVRISALPLDGIPN